MCGIIIELGNGLRSAEMLMYSDYLNVCSTGEFARIDERFPFVVFHLA